MGRKRENAFQRDLKKEIKQRFPGLIVLKADPNDIQGIPDLLVLNGNHWAALECKREKGATHQSNQDLYIEMMNNMSFASFIYPENKEEVLNGMARLFESGTKRKSRFVFTKQLPLAELRRKQNDRLCEVDESEGAWYRTA